MIDSHTIEILAPVGNQDALNAAISQQADAIYFGLTSINARRGATNFEPSELPDLVEQVHNANAKAYLALNITLTDREVGKAYRIVELAAKSKVDAIIICDPALIFLQKLYPTLEFHFSTQAACSNEEDIAMAKELGIHRVVLARENSIDEIKIMTKMGVDTEVFVQGAMCFAVSGRCLLSSWGGGKSGNRGACTSPCRVPWGANQEAGCGTPFSMYDLGAVEQVPELIKAGVTSLKIEGRLKKGDWVASAVKLYKSATNQQATEQLKENAEELGQYAGRKQSDAFLKGSHTKMTGQSGRTSSEEPTEEQPQEKTVLDVNTKAIEGITIAIDTSQPKTLMTATWGAFKHQWQVTKSKANKKRAMTLSQVAEVLMDTPVYDTKVTAVDIPNDDLLFPNRFIGKVVDELYTFIRINQKVEKKVTIKLPAEAKALSLKPVADKANNQPLGSKPTVLRIDAAQIKDFDGLTRYQYIIENASLDAVAQAEKVFTAKQITIALPTIFYSNQIESLTEILKLAVKEQMTIEVNSWGGLHLAKEMNAHFVAGPGLAITNGRAGDFLKNLGCQKVYWSIEADRKILTDLSQSTPLPARMTVASYPVLMHSRVEFPEKAYGKTYQDRREIKMKMTMNHGITTLRTEKPYSLLKQKDENITAAQYVIDLTGLDKPRKTLKQFLSCSIEAPSLFNFDKSLF